MPCRSERDARSTSTVSPHLKATLLIESFELAQHGGAPLGQDGLRQLLEHRAKPTHDLDRRVSVLADLGDAQREVVRPAPDRDHESALHVLERRARVRQIRLADETKQVFEVVEHLHRGRRVVHGRRQRADRDVHHDPDGERRVLLDRPLDAEGDQRPQLVLRLGTGIWAVDVEQGRARGDEVADRMAQHDEAVVRMCPLPEPAKVDRLDRAATNHPNDAHRFARRAERGGNDGRCVRPRGLLEHLAKRLATCLRDERGDRDRPESMDRAIEEDDEEEDPEPEERPCHGHAEVRDVVLLDVAHERVREREGADQHREHGLEGPVAIEDPHVARRERPRRHLHDEDAHGDDEAHETHARRDDRGEHGLRRRRRVLPASGQLRNRAEIGTRSTPHVQPSAPPTRGTTHRLSRR